MRKQLGIAQIQQGVYEPNKFPKYSKKAFKMSQKIDTDESQKKTE